MAFQLTPSRRATQGDFNTHGTRRISTHALTEGDAFRQSPVNAYLIFQLTPSRRATLSTVSPKISSIYFNSRPHGGRQGNTSVFHAGRHFNSRPHGGRQGADIETKRSIIFQLTPSRRATCVQKTGETTAMISTHALTEGDGKFRQIFLLNRGYAYSISLYFLPHFISLLPQILSFQQKSFKFQVRIFLLFSVHLAFALQNQCVHHVKSRFCTNMFYFVFVLFTQIVKPQTIGLFIYDFF